MGVQKPDSSTATNATGDTSKTNVSSTSPSIALRVPNGHDPSTVQAVKAKNVQIRGVLHRWRRVFSWAAFILALSWALMKMSEE
jgi:hypothetical protein